MYPRQQNGPNYEKSYNDRTGNTGTTYRPKQSDLKAFCEHSFCVALIKTGGDKEETKRAAD